MKSAPLSWLGGHTILVVTDDDRLSLTIGGGVSDRREAEYVRFGGSRTDCSTLLPMTCRLHGALIRVFLASEQLSKYQHVSQQVVPLVA